MAQQSEYFSPLNDALSPDADLKKWLYGIGASSYFAFRQTGKQLHISRFSEQGKLECEGGFEAQKRELDLTRDFEISYPSHCAKVTLQQDGQELIYLQQNWKSEAIIYSQINVFRIVYLWKQIILDDLSSTSRCLYSSRFPPPTPISDRNA